MNTTLNLLKIDTLTFDAQGLIPVVALDHDTGEVRMVAYANREALLATGKTGQAHYWSRSRSKLWRKGEESGNTQEVLALKTDCDGDAVLYLIRQRGPACHTGARNCFTSDGGALPALFEKCGLPAAATLGVLAETIHSRRESDPEKSYTAQLLSGSVEKPARKVGEEALEVVLAAMQGQPAQLKQEAADLLYHLLVLLEHRNVRLDEVLAVLQQRMR